MWKMIVVCVGAATDEEIAHASRDVTASGPVYNVAQESTRKVVACQVKMREFRDIAAGEPVLILFWCCGCRWLDKFG